jgi:hypothetical protein
VVDLWWLTLQEIPSSWVLSVLDTAMDARVENLQDLPELTITETGLRARPVFQTREDVVV